MNWTTIEGNWDQFKGKVKDKWGKLTDDDLQQAKGKRDVLIGKLKERYGEARERIEAQVDEWIEKM